MLYGSVTDNVRCFMVLLLTMLDALLFLSLSVVMLLTYVDAL